jgi:hypothetical protein
VSPGLRCVYLVDDRGTACREPARHVVAVCVHEHMYRVPLCRRHESAPWHNCMDCLMAPAPLYHLCQMTLMSEVSFR